MATYRRLLSYLRPHRWAVLLAWLISLGVLALQALTAWVGASFIERILRGGDASAAFLANVGGIAESLASLADRLLTRSTPFGSLVAGLGILVATGLLTMGLRVWKTALFARITQAVLLQVRVQMFEHLTRLDLTFSKRRRPGEIASLLTRDVDNLRGAIIDLCDRVFMQPSRLVLAMAMLASLSPRLTGVLVLSLLVCGATAHWAGGRVHRLSRRLIEQIGTIQGFLTEYLTTVLLARSLGRETRETERFSSLCGDLARADRELAVTESLAPQLITNVFFAAAASVLLCGGYQVLASGTLSSGVLLRFVLCLPLAAVPVESLALLYLSSRRATASAARVFALLDEPATAADRPGAVDPPGPLREIAFQDIAFRPDGKAVLSGLSLTIPAGSRVLVSGPSGSGKTTLLHFLAGVLRPDAGRVLVNGLDLAGFRGERWRARIGLVPQEPVMLNGTVRENLRFANEEASDEEILQVLRQVLFQPKGSDSRDVLDRPVGNRGELISGGERQRLAIARALLNHPTLLLLDEPVAHLDPDNRERVRLTLRTLPRDVTLVFTSHDPNLNDLADIHLPLAG